MDRNQEVDETDDFDIYADLDDHKIDLDFGDNTANDFDFTDKTLISETYLSKNDTKYVETDEEISEPNDQMVEDMASRDTSVAQTMHVFEDHQNDCDTKRGYNESNDLILSEITILDNNLQKAQEINKTLQSKNEELMKQLEQKDKQLLILKRNISSLYKTAKAEISRHKRETDDLRSGFDSIIFRRLPRKDQKVEESVALNIEAFNEKNYSNNSSQTNERDFKQISENLNSKV